MTKKLKQTQISTKALFAIVMVGAVFPDIDLFYFYFVDDRSVHHHKYFLHWFSFWIPIFLSSFLWLAIFKRQSKIALAVCLFCGAAILHIILDTFVGDIWLFAPFIDKPYVFFEVTAKYQPWWLNFILHWSFLVEILITIYALWIFITGKFK